MAEIQKEEVITPTLQACILCDALAKDPSGKLVFVGVFDAIMKPVTLPQFFVVVRWAKGKGVYQSNIKILDPDLKKIVKTDTAKFVLQHEAEVAQTVHQFVNFNFPHFGVYWIVVMLDGRDYASFPLSVFDS